MVKFLIDTRNPAYVNRVLNEYYGSTMILRDFSDDFETINGHYLVLCWADPEQVQDELLQHGYCDAVHCLENCVEEVAA